MARPGILELSMIVILFLTLEVRSERSADQVYLLLDDRLNYMVFKIDAIEDDMRNNLASINQRIDNLEAKIPPMTEHSDNNHAGVNKNPQDVKIQKALQAEKMFIRKMMDGYHGQFSEFKNLVENQVLTLNKTLETTNEEMKTQTEETKLAFDNTIKWINESTETWKAIIERELKDKTQILQAESETKLQDAIVMLETSMNKTSSDHVTEYNKLNEMLNQVDTKIETVEKNFDNSVDKKIKTIETTMSKQSIDISHVKSSLRFSKDRRLAYYSYSGSSVDHTKHIKPTAVYINKGNGYSMKTGKFTARTDGIYLFHVRVGGLDGTLITQVKCKLYIGDYVVSSIDNQTPTPSVSITDVIYMYGRKDAHVTCDKVIHIHPVINFSATLIS